MGLHNTRHMARVNSLFVSGEELQHCMRRYQWDALPRNKHSSEVLDMYPARPLIAFS